MNVYILSEDADLDLDDIWEYIAQDDIDAADRWTGKLFDAFEAQTFPLKTDFPCLKSKLFC